ncbi:NAD-dependent epimerase/dehydratase family protein [Streptomyces sp. NBC_00237]|uniref:NAD-dependent epimerase/dehydratase family protein n=1 Tax=Streptomyces sp. NBC_00237 TaxID=2975687 RepID=UPI00224F631E|nr:NAD-dependent epimerase/dehydratase family protein [Streptomyces sp. NBC_00237]MCX5205965.1 NAD-dependent epimerase/dehydratase family protein [Streptomyces sp. NBC_00237]
MKVLVTGGSGFLGRSVCQRLLHAGHHVVALQRHHSPLLPTDVQQTLGDLRDASVAHRAVRGCQAVVHTAAKAGIWGSRRDFYEANVRCTDHLLAACRAHGTERFVHTSSASVVFDGSDIRGGDESLPYPPRYLAPYPWSKAVAERSVLAANCPDLSTVALRVHLIWGPGDPHFLPLLTASVRRGRFPLIGTGSNIIDTVHIDNAAQAHLDALNALAHRGANDPASSSHPRQPDPAPAAGRAYFITQGEPLPLATMARHLLQAGGIHAQVRPIPVRAATALAPATELLWRAVRRPSPPPLTPFLVSELVHDHWFDITAARRDLAYRPRTSTRDGLMALAG